MLAEKWDSCLIVIAIQGKWGSCLDSRCKSKMSQDNGVFIGERDNVGYCCQFAKLGVVAWSFWDLVDNRVRPGHLRPDLSSPRP